MIIWAIVSFPYYLIMLLIGKKWSSQKPDIITSDRKFRHLINKMKLLNLNDFMGQGMLYDIMIPKLNTMKKYKDSYMLKMINLVYKYEMYKKYLGLKLLTVPQIAKDWKINKKLEYNIYVLPDPKYLKDIDFSKSLTEYKRQLLKYKFIPDGDAYFINFNHSNETINKIPGYFDLYIPKYAPFQIGYRTTYEFKLGGNLFDISNNKKIIRTKVKVCQYPLNSLNIKCQKILFMV